MDGFEPPARSPAKASAPASGGATSANGTEDLLDMGEGTAAPASGDGAEQRASATQAEPQGAARLGKQASKLFENARGLIAQEARIITDDIAELRVAVKEGFQDANAQGSTLRAKIAQDAKQAKEKGLLGFLGGAAAPAPAPSADGEKSKQQPQGLRGLFGGAGGGAGGNQEATARAGADEETQPASASQTAGASGSSSGKSSLFGSLRKSLKQGVQEIKAGVEELKGDFSVVKQEFKEVKQDIRQGVAKAKPKPKSKASGGDKGGPVAGSGNLRSADQDEEEELFSQAGTPLGGADANDDFFVATFPVSAPGAAAEIAPGPSADAGVAAGALAASPETDLLFTTPAHSSANGADLLDLDLVGSPTAETAQVSEATREATAPTDLASGGLVVGSDDWLDSLVNSSVEAAAATTTTAEAAPTTDVAQAQATAEVKAQDIAVTATVSKSDIEAPKKDKGADSAFDDLWDSILDD